MEKVVVSGETLAKKTIEMALRVSEAVEDAYRAEDGFLHCIHCDGVLQEKRETLFGEMIIPVTCSCRQNKAISLDDYEREQAKKKRIKELQKLGLKDDTYLKSTFEANRKGNSDNLTSCMNFVANFKEFSKDGKGLLLYGACGTGKTFYAGCIANELINDCKYVVMTNLAKLVGDMIANFGEKKDDVLNMVRTCDLLILDDLGTERATSTVHEKIFEVIDTRYRSNKPMIVTTNLTPKQMQDTKDLNYERVYRRILEKCLPIEIVDRVENDDEKYKQLLIGGMVENE